MSCRIHPEVIQEVIEFHGHSCPGVAIGIRAAEMALLRFEPEDDDDLVCIAETRMCALDGIQFLSGCTLGKGNLIVEDGGDAAFTFFDRRSGKGFRARLRDGLCPEIKTKTDTLHKKMERDGATHDDEHAMQHLREDLRLAYLNMELADMFDVQPATRLIP